jgi:hypothetical protein
MSTFYSSSFQKPVNQPVQSSENYSGNKETPIFMSGKKERFTMTEAFNILHSEARHSSKCTTVPLCVKRNLAFLVDISKLKSKEDIKADMNGKYKKTLRSATWTVVKTNPVEIERQKLELEKA